MGFDVTFHPIGEKELRHFFFDVLADPTLATERAAELCPDAKKRKKVAQVYRALPQFVARREPVTAFGVCAAIVSGFLHPYWYARGQAFSLLDRKQVPEVLGLFVPLGKLGSDILSKLSDPSDGRFLGNESASGLIPADRIARAEQLLEALNTRPGPDALPILATAFDEDGLESLRAALHYCRSNRLGMIEASDVVVPIADKCCTDESNLRAPFLGKMEP